MRTKQLRFQPWEFLRKCSGDAVSFLPEEVHVSCHIDPSRDRAMDSVQWAVCSVLSRRTESIERKEFPAALPGTNRWLTVTEVARFPGVRYSLHFKEAEITDVNHSAVVGGPPFSVCGRHLFPATCNGHCFALSTTTGHRRFGGRLILDWLVLVVAFVATSLRLAAVRTDLDTVGTDDEQEPLSTSGSGKSAD